MNEDERRLSYDRCHLLSGRNMTSQSTASNTCRRQSALFGMAQELEEAAEQVSLPVDNELRSLLDVGRLDQGRLLIHRMVVGESALVSSIAPDQGEGVEIEPPVSLSDLDWGAAGRSLGSFVADRVLNPPAASNLETLTNDRCCHQLCIQRVHRDEPEWWVRMRAGLQTAKELGKANHLRGCGLGSGRATSPDLLGEIEAVISQHNTRNMCMTSLLVLLKGYASNWLVYSFPPEDSPEPSTNVKYDTCCKDNCLKNFNVLSVENIRTEFRRSHKAADIQLWKLLHERECCYKACYKVVGQRKINSARLKKLRNTRYTWVAVE